MKYPYLIPSQKVKKAAALVAASCLIISLPAKLSAQAPTISYSSPQTYTTNVAITTLTPTSSNVAAPAYNSTPAPIGSGFSGGYGIAVDAAGNIYVADQHNNAIKKIPFSGGAIVSIGSGFDNPTGVAIDAPGNIYVADFGNAAVEEIPAGSTTPVSIGSGFVSPHGIAVDAGGNVYIVDTGNNELIEMPAGGGREVVLASGLNDPSGVAVDAFGNIYVAETGSVSGDVKEFPAGGAAAVLIGSGFTNPTGVAMDASGNLFIADPGVPNVKEILAGSTTPVIIGSTFTFPGGVAVDRAGNVFVTDLQSVATWKISPAGGYFISPVLPAGLTFNGATGKISGTPAMYSPAVNYTIIAWNTNGSAKATLRMAVNTTLPAITYSSAKTYTAGTAITPIVPVNSGGPVAAPAYSSSAVPLGSGFNRPQGLVVDAAGNVYVSDFTSATVQKIPAGGGTPVVIGTGFSDPQGLAIDASGYVYVADHNNGVVKKMPPAGGTPVVVAGGFNDPDGVAFDAAGNLYIADAGNHAVKELLVGATTPVVLANGFSAITGIAADAFGNVYVVDGGTETVYEIPVGSAAYFSIGSGFISPEAIAVDAAGNIFVADFNANFSIVKEIMAANGSTIILTTAFNAEDALAVDAAGNLYGADNTDSFISELKPVGGYNISKTLPPGLILNATTGAISGTPTAASPATTYTITGYNVDGGSSAMQSITVKLPPPPAISYTGPVTYNTLTTISPLSPANSGGAVDVPGYSTGLTGVGSGFNLPFGVASDASGNVYVADAGNSAVKKIPAGGGAATTVGSGFISPRAVAVDAAGNVYVADDGTNTIQKIPGGTGTPVTVGSGYGNPYGVAVDAAGNIYVADAGNGKVYEILAAGGQINFASGNFISPYGVAVDAAGNVYVADYSYTTIKEILAGAGTVVDLGSGFSFPAGVTVDPAGNVYVADVGNSALKEIPVNSSTVVTLHSGFNQVNNIAADAAGGIYVTDVGAKTVSEIKPLGGYFINRFLPSGLAFNSTTGVISGTPAVVSPAANYTVSAYNYGGRSPAVVNITVNALLPPTLSYSSPQDYSINNAITPLAPTGSGVAALGYATATTAYGSGFSNPFNLSFDGAGNMYVADFLNNAVKKVPAGNGTPVTLGSGFNRPTGVVVDSAGNVFVDDSGNKLIKEIPAGSNTPVVYGGDYFNPQGLTSDRQGNLYCLDGGSVLEIPAGGFGALVIKTGFGNAYGLAIDDARNIYVADYDNNEIKKFPLAGGPVTVVGYVPLASPEGVAVDAAANVYVAYTGNNTVMMYPADGSEPVNIGSGYGGPTGVAVDASGVVYVADANSSIERAAPVGGYFLNEPLAPGLNFSNATGVISGTPTASPPTTNYTITAYNPAGSQAAILAINVNPFPLSYGGAQTFNTGVPITPIAPVSSGVAAPAFSGPLTLATNLVDPTDVVVDAAGNTYVTGFQALYKISPAGTVTSSTLGISLPSGHYVAFQGVAIDKQGNLYVSSGDTFDVYKVPAGTNTAVVLASFSNPTSLGVDDAGNVYVLDEGSNLYVEEFPVTGGPPIVLATFTNGATGIAVDGPGNVYVNAGSGIGYYKIHPGGAVIDTVTSFNGTDHLAVDPSGNLYATSGGNVVEYPTTRGNTIIGAGDGGHIYPGTYYNGLRADGAGHIYALNLAATNSIYENLNKINPLGGYYISPFLPAGLTFNSTTGVISGTPAAPSPATTYTITAYNGSGGSSTATVTITVNLVNPTVTYSSPQTFQIGTAIIPALAPASSAVSPPGYSTSPIFLGDPASLGYLSGDVAGNVYVVGFYNNADVGVFKFPHGGTPVLLAGYPATGPYPASATADAAGNVYYVTNNAGSGGANIGTLYKIAAGTTTSVAMASPFYNPYAIATDAAGNVYIADSNGTFNHIEEFPAGTTSGTIIGNFPGANGLAVNSAGDLYLANAGGAGITYKLIRATGVIDTIKSDFPGQGITVDGAGNIYFTSNGNILEIPPSGGTARQIITGNNINPTASPGVYYGLCLSIDGAGNLYAANMARNNPSTGFDDIEEIKPIGGYYITPSIPAGIIFNNATGVISGTPTALSPATNYTVTAYNNYGGVTTQTINMQVVPSANASLTKLVLSSGSLSPAFAGGTTSYTAAVANTVTSITVTPTAADILAIIKVNGAAVASGAKSAAINLNIGTNLITTVVTSEDGTASKTYTVTVTRPLSSDATLSSMGPSSAPLTPLFTPATTSYTLSVSNAIANLTVKPVSNNASSTIKVNGTAITSGTVSAPIPLAAGTTTPVNVMVTAQDGTVKTYTITVSRAPSTVATLSGIGSSITPLAPLFNANTTSYTLNVSNSTATMTVKPVTTDANATIKVNGTALLSGTTSGAIALAEGTTTTINLVVTAQDGATIKTYTINVTRGPSSVASLSNILLSSGTLSPVFAAATTSYTAGVSNSTATITVTPTSTDANAAITVNGSAVTPGTASGAITLAEGASTAISVVVTAQNETITKTYTITVTRAPSTNASLTSMGPSVGPLSPVFTSGTTSYSLSVPNTRATMTVTPLSADVNATIKVNGTALLSGTTSGAIALAEGTTTTINVAVTAQDGVTAETYTLTVTRAPSAIATLSNIQLSSGTITPAFKAFTTSYTAGVANSTSTITVTPTATDANAVIKVNGTTVTSGTASPPIALAEGTATAISVVAASQDGTATKTYTITVTRAPSGNASLTSMGPSVGPLSPVFTSGTTSYSLSVPNTRATMTVTPVSADVNATIKVNGTALLSGTTSGAIALAEGTTTTINVAVTAQDGITAETYTLTVTRAPSAIPTLSNIQLSSGTITPAFKAFTTSYTAGVANNASTITVTPTGTDANAVIKVNGTTVTSGTASPPIALAEGAATAISVVAASQDGTATKTYTITVTRAPSSDATLSVMGPQFGPLAPVFNPGTTGYTLSVSNSTKTMTVKPVSTDVHATLKVNGTTIPSGTTSAPIALAVGSNTISAAVMAQDGTTSLTYTITVTRAAGGADSYVPIAIGLGISVSKPTETATLAEDGIIIHHGVSPNGDGINDFLQIDNISQYPDNRLTIMNRNGQLIYEVNGYDNSSKIFDGHSNKNGQMQLPGTYFYQLDYTVKGTTKHKTGFIVLKY